MERLWTPWRMDYVAGEKALSCVFCEAVTGADDASSLVLHRGASAFVILNLYPYNSGHAMIVPNAHVAQLGDLDPAARAELMELATLFVHIARRVLRCAGFNLGLNLGEVAGAGVAEHLHLHAVPRWLGDANFMPILAGTTVMPELLPVTYARLRGELERALVEHLPGSVPEAGALVALPERGGVALRRARDGAIVIPKGHIEADETSAEAAAREVREETGIEATLTGWAGSFAFNPLGQATGASTHHLAVYIASGRETVDLEACLAKDTLVVPVDDVVDALTHEASKLVARQALPALRRILDETHAS